MASTSSAIAGALIALLCWGAVGYPLARRLVGASLSWAFAPLMGWAMQSVLALLVFLVIPFSTFNIAAVGVLSLAASIAVVRLKPGSNAQVGVRVLSDTAVPRWAFVVAALLAIACAAAVLPKQLGDAVALASPIFDHSKVSIIDDMARLGVPPGNPFFAHDGGSGRLAYYYLWYFGAAELTHVAAISGWEADIAMTFFSAFTSLSLMMALAVRFSGRAVAAYWVVALAASSWGRALIDWLFGKDAIEPWLPAPGGFGGWLFQSSWVPQHLASTSCVLCAVYLMNQLVEKPSMLVAAVLALMVAAGFESSTWVGGVVFAVSCLLIVPTLLAQIAPARRRAYVLLLGAVTLLAGLLSARFLLDQAAASALRHQGSPIAIVQFDTLGDAFSPGIRFWWDQPAYWLLLLPVEFTGYYITGMLFMVQSVWRSDPRSDARRLSTSYAALAMGALLVAGFLVSTLADNNDLGWRAGLLASTVLIAFAGAGIAMWLQARRWVAVVLAAGAIALGGVGTVAQIHSDFVGNYLPAGREFAQAPALWNMVRSYSSPSERVVNNPLALKEMTPWPVNISWSLLANRRSCYPGWELAQVYTSVPHDRLKKINDQFERVFAGRPEQGDVSDMATQYDCAVAVVTPDDGAWTHDPFTGTGLYHIVNENPGHWRIYRRLDRTLP